MKPIHCRTLATYTKKRSRKQNKEIVFGNGLNKEEALEDLKNKLLKIKNDSKLFEYSKLMQFCDAETNLSINGITYIHAIFIENEKSYFQENVDLKI